MSANDLYEVRFIWPHPEPATVIVTGTFDDWSASTPLTKNATGFEGTTKIPWGQKIKYKFVVDGQWITHEDQETEIDPGGFVNNVYTAPPKPAGSTPAEAATAVVEAVGVPTKDAEPIANGHVTNGHSVVPEVVAENPASEAPEAPVEEAKPRDSSDRNAAPAAPSIEPPPRPGTPLQLLADLASTIVARDGTSSALGYVASGLGAAMHSVVGVDPVNLQKIAIPTPKPDDVFTLPGGQESVPNTAELPLESAPPTAAGTIPSPIAPKVPIMIVPVNAAENNTSSPLETEAIVPASVPEASVPADAVPAADDTTAKVEETSTHIPVPQAGDKPVEQTPAVIQSEPATETVVEHAKEKETPTVSSEPESTTSAAVKPEVSANEPEVAPVSEPVVKAPPVEVKAGEPPVPAAPVVDEPASEAKAEEPSAPEPTSAPVAGEPVAYAHIEEAYTPQLTHTPPVEEPAEVKAGEPSMAKSTSTPAVEAPVKTEEPSKPEPGPVSVVEETVAEIKAEEPSATGPSYAAEEPAVNEQAGGPSVAEETATVKAEAAPLPEPTSALAAKEPMAEVEPHVPEPVKEEAVPVAPSAEQAAVDEKLAERHAPEPIPAVEAVATEHGAVTVETAPEVSEAKEAPVAPAVEESTAEKAESAPTTIAEPSTVPPPVEDKAAEAPTVTPIGTPATEPLPTATKAEEVVEAKPVAEKEAVFAETAPLTAEGESTAVKVEEKPATNGDVKTPAPEAAAGTPTATPVKNGESFPSTSESANASPSSSKFNSVRKKRTSIFGKLKNIFHHDKEKETEKK
ncbi:hypothetical protein GALMADRAFT_274896 [Galerina marginata CBS 339.88]|uniref:AMP-activated protein kinase glycogen-binding domain-containing protein n=1 Tax=Galerina marginata (strain CBS 339.88) TaxID=685588 RepID=A0A067TK09_GALM3|nr:hypothetical protein GALMADRAFT_274896 [Galerina marginata CBS 339.88]